METESTKRVYHVAALYCFARLEHFAALRDPLFTLCQQHGIKGTLLLASEGVNGTIAGLKPAIDLVVGWISSQPELTQIELKYSTAQTMPFRRMKVKLKKEIVTMGVANVDPLQKVGTYVLAEDWNKLIQDEETLVIDTRNDYEYRIGTFAGAVVPPIKTFREFPEWFEKQSISKKKKIAMFCTGGIRCEKSTAWLRTAGFDQVYHLQGGILSYLEKIPVSESLWQGSCFVFDERVAVGHGLVEENFVLCRACRQPLDEAARHDRHYVAGVSCAACYHERSDEDRQRYAERQRQMQSETL